MGFKVYCDSVKGPSAVYGPYTSLEEAKAKYNEVLHQYDAIYLSKDGEDLESMESPEYKSYLRKQEVRELCHELFDDDDAWRPGDAPWDAPGMSIRDFFN